ncbi:MAG: DUF4625 domain-containing protein [Saprospiraceae bacterium]
MTILKHSTLLIIALLFFNACDDNEIDTEKPSIDLSMANAFPISCDTLYFDESFTVKTLLSDNAELGSYNIDIHNNFDQHAHSTEFEQCMLDAVKTAVNPYVFIQDYTIPAASSEYTTEASLTVPSSDGTDLYDEGDYHFQITVIDKEGWSSLIGINVKILRR